MESIKTLTNKFLVLPSMPLGLPAFIGELIHKIPPLLTIKTHIIPSLLASAVPWRIH